MTLVPLLAGYWNEVVSMYISMPVEKTDEARFSSVGSCFFRYGFGVAVTSGYKKVLLASKTDHKDSHCW